MQAASVCWLKGQLLGGVFCRVLILGSSLRYSSKSVQVLFNAIEAVLVLTSIDLIQEGSYQDEGRPCRSLIHLVYNPRPPFFGLV